MKTTDLTPADTIVSLSPHELSLVRNVVTFVLEEFCDGEFHARLGVDQDEARILIRLLDSNELALDDGSGIVFSKINERIAYSSFVEVLYGLPIDDHMQSLGASRDCLLFLGEKFGVF